jgi:hypothetical protein
LRLYLVRGIFALVQLYRQRRRTAEAETLLAVLVGESGAADENVRSMLAWTRTTLL